MSNFEIRIASSITSELRDLAADADRHMASLYPAHGTRPVPIESFMGTDSALVGAWCNDQLAGCGAARLLQTSTGNIGEIKRLFVSERHRRTGISTAIIRELESFLLHAGASVSLLVTGIRQPEAVSLYRKLGYVERNAYGDYAPDLLSVFMEKRLVA